MTSQSIADDSARGWANLPAAYEIPEVAPSEAEAREYCRRLARSHYENFSVATWFLVSEPPMRWLCSPMLQCGTHTQRAEQ